MKKVVEKKVSYGSFREWKKEHGQGQDLMARGSKVIENRKSRALSRNRKGGTKDQLRKEVLCW